MSEYESRDTRYETFSIDRREAYFERSAKYRNARYDFAARYARGEAYQKGLWRPVLRAVPSSKQITTHGHRPLYLRLAAPPK